MTEMDNSILENNDLPAAWQNPLLSSAFLNVLGPSCIKQKGAPGVLKD